MSALITAALPLVFKLVEWMLAKGKAKDEQRKAFLVFVQSYQQMESGSTIQYDEVLRQLDELKKTKNN